MPDYASTPQGQGGAGGGIQFDPYTGWYYDPATGQRWSTGESIASSALGPGLDAYHEQQAQAAAPAPAESTPAPQGGGMALDEALMRYLAKVGVTPGSNQVAPGQQIFDIPGTTYDPGSATQRGIYL